MAIEISMLQNCGGRISDDMVGWLERVHIYEYRIHVILPKNTGHGPFFLA